MVKHPVMRARQGLLHSSYVSTDKCTALCWVETMLISDDHILDATVWFKRHSQ
jgi:hypothetical protein